MPPRHTRPRCDMGEAPGHRSRDWVARRRSLTLAWGLPSLALASSLFVEPPVRAWIWVPGLVWMGAACAANARRCGRTHCYFTAPLFFLMAFVALLDGLGLLVLGPRAWTWLGLGLVIGTAGLWWGSERLWGQFFRFDFQGQASKGSLTSRHHTTLRNDCRGFVHEIAHSGVPRMGSEGDPKKAET